MAESPNAENAEQLRRTPLYDAHVGAGGKMVPFAGWEMPVQYAGENGGVLAEHRWTREHAGLFDVSHMGQGWLEGADPLTAFERVVSGDYQSLKVGRQKYSLLLNEDGGIVDDLMAARPDDSGLFVVVNASGREKDFDILERAVGNEAVLTRLDDRALLALQGPEAAMVLSAHAPEVADMGFMDSRIVPMFGVEAIVSRSGYTGEDGYEISVPADAAERVWDTLLADDRVRPIGLGARDSLRLEAGLPLYGHDVDESTSPVEAALTFAVSKKRLAAGDMPGADRIRRETEDGPGRVRVGLRIKDGAPAREGAEIADADGRVIGKVTSGGPSPSLGAPVAMGYVPPAFAELGTALKVLVRGRAGAAEVVATPFVPQRYYRKPKA